MFGLGVTLLFVVMLFMSAALGALLPGQGYTSPGAILGRLIACAALLGLQARLGWLRSAGAASPGPARLWLALPLPLAYAVGAAALAVTGRLSLSAFGPAPSAVAGAFIFTAALLEGVAFRGMVQHSLIRAWGGDPRGRALSLLAAALFFGSVHLLDALSGRPMLAVAVQSGQAAVLGVWLGALGLRGGSLYPAVAFHALFNLAGYQLFGRQGLEPAPTAWLLLAALLLPLAAIALGWLRAAPRRLDDQTALAGLPAK